MVSERSIDTRLREVLMLLALVGCGRAIPPGTLVGESEHFRLYVDPEATVPPGLDGANGLAALETEWADVHSMLQMPDGEDHLLLALAGSYRGGVRGVGRGGVHLGAEPGDRLGHAPQRA